MSITPIRPGFDDPQTYAINGAAMAVHRELGCGFLESVYHEALAIELALRDIPFKREVRLPVHYRDRQLSVVYKVDFICFERVLVEVKALGAIGPIEEAQARNYLKSHGIRTRRCAELRCFKSAAPQNRPESKRRPNQALK